MNNNLDTNENLLKDLKQIEKKYPKIKSKKQNMTYILENKKQELKILKNRKKLLEKEILSIAERKEKIIKHRIFSFLVIEITILILSLKIVPINEFKNLLAILTYLNIFLQATLGTKEFLKKVYLPQKNNESKINEMLQQIKKQETEILKIKNKLDLLEKEEKKIKDKQEYMYLLIKMQYLIYKILESKKKPYNINVKKGKILLKDEQLKIKKLTKKG